MSLQQKACEKRKQEIESLLLPYVRQSPSALRMADQYQTIKAIVDGVRDLSFDLANNNWFAEFYGGSEFCRAGAVAWLLHSFTRKSVRFTFNGSEIVIDDMNG